MKKQNTYLLRAKEAFSIGSFSAVMLLTLPLITAAQEKIAFLTDRDAHSQIYVMDPDGSNQINLSNNAAGDTDPSFSADGGKITFRSDRDGNFEIYVMNSDGSNQTRLTYDAAFDSEPSFSPDGSKVAFVSRRDGNDEIYVMDSDGSNQINLTTDPGFDGFPAFSPDGNRIAFTSSRDGNLEIYVMNADGTNVVRLTNDAAASDFDSSFHPDGSRIAFNSNRDLNFEIYVMNSDGSNPINLSNSSAFDGFPSFSPDGSRIAFRSDRDGSNTEIYGMNSDGSNQINLSNNSATDNQPSWGRLPETENTPPVAQCRDVAVILPSGATTTDADVNNDSFDVDGDALSLLYSPAGPYQVGSTLVTLTVNDGRDGEDSCRGTATVLYNFAGFFQPVDNLPALNEVKAGSAVPVKFSLDGDKGLDIFAPGFPSSGIITCGSTGTADEVEETVNAGVSSLTYDAATDRYKYVWKTDKNWKGQCRQLAVRLKDGTAHIANFRFK